MQQLDNLLYIWHQRILYIGPSYHPRKRQYNTALVLIGLDCNFHIKDDKDNSVISTQMALLPPSKPVFIDTENGNVAAFYLDYFCNDYRSLKELASQSKGPLYYGFDSQLISQSVQLLKQLSKESATIQEAGKLLPILGLKPHTLEDFYNIPDERLKTLAKKYLTGELHRNCKVEEAAEAVGISASRLAQLFRLHFGLTFKSFRNRMLIHCYLLSTAHGKSFSEAAIEAGYADQSHFCKHFKRQTGLHSTLYIKHRALQKSFVDPEISELYQQYFKF